MTGYKNKITINIKCFARYFSRYKCITIQKFGDSKSLERNYYFYSERMYQTDQTITVSINTLHITTVFNIDNNQKYFLSSKSAYLL